MSAPAPVLVLQMQRMGDLILSFPLLLWLQRTMPGHPVWVVAEEMFFSQLVPLSPAATYFPWTRAAAQELARHPFSLVVNLSHRPEAAELAGAVAAPRKIGPVRENGATYVRGDWQLYRASLVAANRHNRFHWADLNALDLVPLPEMAATGWPAPRSLDAANQRVGLFVGASEEAKRPGSWFWSSLCKELLRRDMRPVLLGGPAEKFLADEIVQMAGGRVLNLAGRLTLSQFAAAGDTLQLMVTPDTGPMHLAAWTGLKTLSLSMGPINSWETGPYQPGHFVLRSKASCVGCWSCDRAQPVCRRNYQPKRIAMAIRQIVRGNAKALAKMDIPSLDLYRTGRGEHGLYRLERVTRPERESSRNLLGRVWRRVFGELFGLWPGDRADAAFAALAAEHPALAERFGLAAVRLGRDLKLAAKGKTLPPDFWASGPPLMRPARSYCLTYLQNEDYATPARLRCLALVERLAGLGR
ncbi:MAG: glycosyltransferase family 9 protein [Thermodesulfobacteriota bacterium]